MKNAKSTPSSNPIIEKLEQLKKKLLTETDLKEIFQYFLDNLGENPQFRESGKVVKHAILKSLLLKAGKAVTGKGQITNMIVLMIKNYPFVHGPLFIDGFTSNIIYFEDIKVGLLCIVYNGNVQIARFSAITEQEMSDLRQTH